MLDLAKLFIERISELEKQVAYFQSALEATREMYERIKREAQFLSSNQSGKPQEDKGSGNPQELHEPRS